MRSLLVLAPFLMLALLTQAQEDNSTFSITGKVWDAENNEPLAFAAVVLFQDSKAIAGATSDFDGNYNISLPESLRNASGKFSLQFQFVGMVTVTKNLEGIKSMNLDVEMRENGPSCRYNIVYTYYPPLVQDFPGVTTFVGAQIRRSAAGVGR